MDHLCEKCAAPVPDGRPFCPQCRAPQVRVVIAAPPPATDAASTDPVLPRSVAPPTSVAAWAPGLDDRRIARSSVIKAGLIGILLGMMIPLLGSVLTGVLAVWLYRRSGGSPHHPGLGARVGGTAAALAFSIAAALNAIQISVLHAQKQSEEAALKLFEALGANVADPQLLASLHWVFTPSGMIFSILVGLLVAAALGALGGAITASSRPRPRP